MVCCAVCFLAVSMASWHIVATCRGRMRLNCWIISILYTHRQTVWFGGVMVTASDLRLTGRGFDSQPFHYQVATLGKLFTHMCLVTKQYNLVPAKGRWWSGVALAMRHRLQWFIHLWAQRLGCGTAERRASLRWEGDEHPTYAPEGQGRLYLFYRQTPSSVLSQLHWLTLLICTMLLPLNQTDKCLAA